MGPYVTFEKKKKKSVRIKAPWAFVLYFSTNQAHYGSYSHPKAFSAYTAKWEK